MYLRLSSENVDLPIAFVIAILVDTFGFVDTNYIVVLESALVADSLAAMVNGLLINDPLESSVSANWSDDVLVN